MNTTFVAAEKHCFDELYNRDNPYGFVSAMNSLSYRTPDYLPSAVVEIRDHVTEHVTCDRITILDLCCGYGLNSLILKHGLDMNAVHNLLGVEDRTPDQLGLRGNFELLGLNGRKVSIIGADIANNALVFARNASLLDSIICNDLEREELTSVEVSLLSGIDVIISTGSLSYITGRTIRALLANINADRPLLMLFWPLLGHDVSGITAALSESRMEVSEAKEVLYWHRHYASPHEREKFYERYQRSGIVYENTLAQQGVCVTRLIAKRGDQRPLENYG